MLATIQETDGTPPRPMAICSRHEENPYGALPGAQDYQRIEHCGVALSPRHAQRRNRADVNVLAKDQEYQELAVKHSPSHVAGVFDQFERAQPCRTCKI
jgi:hypothetical protein